MIGPFLNIYGFLIKKTSLRSLSSLPICGILSGCATYHRGNQMLPHHQQAIDRVIAHFTDHPDFPALIVGGSIAKGWQAPDSDVDIMLVATDDAYARRLPDNQMTYFTTEFCDYEGGYVDGKIIDMAFLRDVAARGSEPARSAFVGAWIAYSRIPGLADMLARITTYPEETHIHKLQSFYAQLEVSQWYIGEAEKRNQRYLAMRYATDLVLFSARMILAHNRILYPFHKWMMTALDHAPDKPDDLVSIMDDLLAEPTKANAARLFECVTAFTDWPKPPEGWPARFMQDVECTWRKGDVYIADW
jgi:hypothetical protein